MQIESGKFLQVLDLRPSDFRLASLVAVAGRE
jgi:hypothetical protein